MVALPPSKLLVLSIIVTSGGPFHFGYQSIVTNPSQKAFLKFVNTSHVDHYGWEMSPSLAKLVWSVTVAILSVGGIFGSLSIGFVSTRIGRKKGLYVSVGLNILGSILSIVSYFTITFELYIIARTIIGFAVSLSLGLSALFLNESSPKRCRGMISMMSSQAINTGTVVAAVIGMPSLLGTVTNWWYLYLFSTLMLLPLLLTLPFIPESPGYLSFCGDDAAAKKAILFYHGCDLAAVEPVLAELKENMKLRAKSMSLKSAFNDRYCRTGILVGTVISSAVTFSGSSTVNAFAVDILVNCGLSLETAAYGNIGVMLITLVFSTFTSFAVERFGRRPLILTSCVGLTIFNIVVFALMYCFESYKLFWIGYTLIGVIGITKFFTAIGVGSLCFFVASELVGQAARGISQTSATTAQMLTRTVCIAIFSTLSEAVGQSFAFLILFVVPIFLSEVFLYFNMPETKNKNHKEVLEAMNDLPSFSKCLRNRGSRTTRVFDVPAGQPDAFDLKEKP